MSMAGRTTHEPDTLEDALRSCGWKPGPDGARWLRKTRKGDALLRRVRERAAWQHLELRGGALPAPANGQVFAANALLAGPAKFVARARGTPVCRLDLPAEWDAPLEDAFAGTGDTVPCGPWSVWANAVTALATGRRPEQPEAPFTEKLVADLKQAGWSASLDDGAVHVHLIDNSDFYQIRLEQQPGRGARLGLDLVELHGLGPESRRAIARLAHEANARLPLARFAVAGGDKPVLRAEVHPGSSRVPGAWLAAMLQSVEAVIALTARELRALRDPGLARLVLAGLPA